MNRHKLSPVIAKIKSKFNPFSMIVQDSQIDPEVTELINQANMEMLATLVLNGEGSRLIGRESRNTELQAFLDNVPTYMVGNRNISINR